MAARPSSAAPSTTDGAKWSIPIRAAAYAVHMLGAVASMFGGRLLRSWAQFVGTYSTRAYA